VSKNDPTPIPPYAKAISDEVVIMTRAELLARERQAFRRGVERGRFEERSERSNPERKPGGINGTETIIAAETADG
jgi:hypothetical protein